MIGSLSVSVTQYCELSGTTEATCTETAALSYDGTKTTSATSSVLTGSEFKQ